MFYKSHSSWLTAPLRGVTGRCPRCGKGRLFERYLKTAAHCSICSEPFDHLPADDMPPWMTILLVGLIIIPAMVYINLQFETKTYIQLCLWIPLALILTLFLLPRCKGLILAILWIQKSLSSNNSSEFQYEKGSAEEDEKFIPGKTAVEYIGHFESLKIIAGYKDSQYHASAYAGRREIKSFSGSNLEEVVRQLKNFLMALKK